MQLIEIEIISAQKFQGIFQLTAGVFGTAFGGFTGEKHPVAVWLQSGSQQFFGIVVGWSNIEIIHPGIV